MKKILLLFSLLLIFSCSSTEDEVEDTVPGTFKTNVLVEDITGTWCCLLYTSPSPRDKRQSRMPSSA